MVTCAACGFEFEGNFKFCPECAAPLSAAASVRAPVEERKVVSGDAGDWAALLPSMVRAALRLDEQRLVERLIGDHLPPRNPYSEHASVAANAALTEARGDLQAAAAAYADAAQRWQAFGVITEQAFAHLGRCLLALDDPTATQPLHQARDLFSWLQAAPCVAECDTLLAQAVERAS